MADYWKSNPRHFCEVCKCWLAADKASIEFHEGGRRHQANAKKKLQDARTRSAANAKEKLNVEKTLSAIEQAAFSAYQKDLAGGKVKKAKPKAPVTAEAEQLLQVQEYLIEEREKVEKVLEKKKIEEHAQKKVQEIQDKALETAYQAYSTAYQIASSWHQCFSPEGYPYFYNTTTGVTQWEVPKELQAAAPPPVANATPTGPLSQPPISMAADTQPVKRSSEEAGLDEKASHHPPKRAGPYGGWTTVAVIEREPEEEEEEGDEDGEAEQEVQDSEEKEQFQFQEKVSRGLAQEEESGERKGEFKGFAFKKRQSKGRPQIRQRTSDF